MLNNSQISLFVSLKSWKLSNKRERETTHPQSSSEGFVSCLGFWQGKELWAGCSSGMLRMRCWRVLRSAAWQENLGLCLQEVRAEWSQDLILFELKKLLYHVLPQILVLQWGPCLLPKYPLCLHLLVQIHPVRLQILIRIWHPLWRGYIGLDSFFTYINNLIFSNVAVNKLNQRIHWLRLEEGGGGRWNNVRICSPRKIKHFLSFPELQWQ